MKFSIYLNRRVFIMQFSCVGRSGAVGVGCTATVHTVHTLVLGSPNNGSPWFLENRKAMQVMSASIHMFTLVYGKHVFFNFPTKKLIIHNADPDQMPHSAASCLAVHYLPVTFGGFPTKMS